MSKLADIIIPHHDRHDHLKKCLEGIPLDNYNVIIISGGTFAENCNKGARLAETDNLIFLNDDVLINERCLKALASSDFDFVGVTEFIPDHNKHFYGVGFKKEKDRWRAFKTTNIKEMRFPTGFLFKMKRKTWILLGGFDERFINGGEDGDLGIRALKQGVSIGWVDTPVKHIHSQSKDRLKYRTQNAELIDKKWSQEEIKKIAMQGLVKTKQEKLSILLATNHLQNLAGSETFTYTMWNELKNKYNVDVFTLHAGLVSEKIPDTIKRLKPNYDLILLNHTTCANNLKKIKGFKIQTCHGIYPTLERPFAGMDAYVSISKEVDNRLKKANLKKVSLIHNGIDTTRFKPKESIRDKPKKVLCLCKGLKAVQAIQEVCMELGYEFESLFQKVWDIENKINESDIVVTLGRGALEAMSCGRAVFIFDDRPYLRSVSFGDGFITKENWEKLIVNNFSGRTSRIFYTKDMIKKCFENEYKKEMGKDNREIVLENFNIEKQVNKYISFYQKNK